MQGMPPAEWQIVLQQFPQSECRRFESNLTRGLPSGSIDFISKLEEQTGLALTRRPRGRPRRIRSALQTPQSSTSGVTTEARPDIQISTRTEENGHH